MKIDVIIPTYNRSSLLERAISSVLNQSYQRFHLYIVDDGSTDDTSLILEKYKSHPLVSILSQENAGVSSARNHAARVSQNDWLSFLDSDDEWMPKKLEHQVRFLQSHPQIEFLHTEEQWIRNGVRVNPKMKHRKSGEDLFKRSLEFCLISPSTVMMKKELFFKYDGFDESMTVCEDYDLWNKILAFHEVGFMSDAFTKKYGGHEDQLSTNFVAMDYLRIKSLIKLLSMTALAKDKKELVINEIQKKGVLLLKGYQKHQNLERYEEVLQMIENKDFKLTP